DVMVVHHVEVHPVRARGEHRVHFLAQAGEIRGQDRGGDDGRLRGGWHGGSVPAGAGCPTLAGPLPVGSPAWQPHCCNPTCPAWCCAIAARSATCSNCPPTPAGRVCSSSPPTASAPSTWCS